MTKQVSTSEENSDPFDKLETIKNYPPMLNQHFPPTEIKAPLDVFLNAPLKQEQMNQMNQMIESLNYVPDIPFENNNYQPQKRAQQISNDFPQKPKMTLLIPEYFKNYPLDTLFYIFFYFAGTPQQYFAGKELQKLGWIFYSEYMTWIRLSGEPSQRTPDFIVGNIDFFDKEKWTIIQKSDFRIDLKKTKDN